MHELLRFCNHYARDVRVCLFLYSGKWLGAAGLHCNQGSILPSGLHWLRIYCWTPRMTRAWILNLSVKLSSGLTRTIPLSLHSLLQSKSSVLNSPKRTSTMTTSLILRYGGSRELVCFLNLLTKNQGLEKSCSSCIDCFRTYRVFHLQCLARSGSV